MPFCYAPDTNIDISPQGVMSPCCKFRWDRYEQAPCNINNASFQDYSQHPVLLEIKQDFQSGRWPSGCDRCRIEEENDIASKRQLDFERWQDQYNHYQTGSGWLTASMAFGNTCNLTCITCGPWASSRWQTEYMSRHGINVAPQHFYKQNFVEEFLKNAPNVFHLDIPGGEPFLSGTREQLTLLQHLVEQGRAPMVSLHYTTNATILPDSDWWKLWSHFKEIDFQISVDGVAEKNCYIRYPSDWNVVYKNIQEFQNQENRLDNFRLSVSHTVSAYNIYYLPEFFDWCQLQGLPKPWLGRVHNPLALRPTVWPDKVRQHIIQHLVQSDHADCRAWAHLMQSNDDSQYFSDFLEFIAWHDNYRGLNFAKTFPELSEFL